MIFLADVRLASVRPSVRHSSSPSWLISAWLEFFSPLSGEDKHKTCEEEDRWEGNTMRSGGYEYLGGGDILEHQVQS